MSKDRQVRPAVKKNAEVMGDPTGKGDCPEIVVGIGGAAGELKSLKQLCKNFPTGHGVAFVVIQRGEPAFENLTVKMLKDQSALAVVEASDKMPVLADHIYLLPPDKFLNISGSRLTLQEPVQCNGLLMPIDHFFCSLAADQRGRGCGILLSGTGGDGTLGLSEIKAAGGRTFAEDPGRAEFSGIAQSAIDAGVVDAVLPVKAMAEAVVALAEQVKARTRNVPSESPEFDAHLRAILDILRAKVGHDFRCYKPNTLVRRIRRRMTLGRIETFAAYAEFLHEHLEEVAFLQKDLLIGVTEFFRQPQAWEILEEKVIAPLVDNARPGAEIRVWVPGCSTGKEAYTLAMLLAEQAEKSGKKVNLQIFGTDSNVASLTAARSGIYSQEEIGENLSPERRKRFFVRKEGFYQVSKEIRDQVVFAPQNLTADPPFSRLDLISCRNVLIYLDQQMQKKIIALFHFALREGGFLFLGNAETVGDHEDLFVPVSKKWRIYRRIEVGRPVGVEIPVRPPGTIPLAEGTLPAPSSTPRMSLTSMAQQMLLDRFVPASVMIDRKLQVIYVHGAVEDYLTFPAGELTTRVVDMAREGLRTRLRAAIGRCLEINRPVSVTSRVLRGGKSVPVKATINPLRYPREADGLLLITFQDYRLSAANSRRPAAAESEVHQLQDELKVTREELQGTIQQLEASNDLLKASNEEVTAANEELQSANEEMETSKEELQSLNEELNAINARLHEKVEELESTNNDIVNLLSSTNIATVFLDKELRVRRYTPASTNLFSLIPSDAGRPIGDVLRHFRDEAFLSDARQVLAVLAPLAKEVQTEEGRWYIRQITPYRTQDDRIEGVVITFVDVCDLKASEEALRRQQAELQTARADSENARRRLAVIVDSIADGFFALDREWRITHVNDAALRHFRKSREEMVGRGLFEVFPAARGTEYEAQYRHSMESGEPVHFEAPSTLSDRMIELHAYPGPDNMTILFRDVTERNRMAAALREAHERAAWLARFPEENPNPVARVSSEGNVLYRNPAAAQLTGWACEVGQPLPAPLLPLVGEAMTASKEAEQDVELGGRFYFVSVSPSPGDRYANVYGRDITERKQAEEALRESEAKYRTLFENMTEEVHFWQLVRDEAGQIKTWRLVDVNPPALKTWGWSTREEIRGKTTDEIFGPGSTNHYLPVVQKIMTEGVPYSFEDYFPNLDKYFRFTSVPLGDYFITTGADISGIKRTEEALRASEQRFRLALRNAPVSVAAQDRDLRYIWAYNQRTARPEEILGKFDADIFTAEEASRLGELKRRVLEENIELREQMWLNRPSGRIFLDVCFEPIRDEAGRTMGVATATINLTPIKNAEEALRQARQDLDRAQAVGQIGSWRLDVRHNVLTWSDENHRIFGIPKGTPLTYERFLGTIHPDDRQYVDTKWQAGLRGEPYDIEHRIAVDQEVKWVREKAYLEFDDGGNLLGGFGITQDITDRKWAEEALRESEIFLKETQSIARVGGWKANPERDFLQWTEGVYRIVEAPLDYKPGLAEGLKFYLPQYIPILRDKLRHSLETGDPFQLECEAVTTTGKRLWTEVRGLAHRIEGKASHVIGTFQDITERKRAEEALRRSEAILRAVLDNNPDPIFLKDRDGRLLLANPATFAVVGKPAEAVIGKTDAEFYDDPATGRAIMKNDRRIMDSGQMEVVEESVSDPAGTRVYLSTKAPYCDAEGRVIGLVGVTREITERKRAEEALRKAKDELEMRVQERTEELTKSQQRLQQLSSQLLLAQEKERKRVAVELHDGLMSELAATKFLLEGKIMLLDKGKPVDPAELRRVVDILAGTMKEARRLMNNLHPSTLDELGLIATISWLCGEYQTSYPHITVQKEIAVSEKDIAEGIRVVIYRVLQEALNNFARHGKGDRVEVSLSKSDGTFSFVIRDNGQGFDVENAQKGLGLESMRERVELSGGEFQIESTTGQGTTIRANWSR